MFKASEFFDFPESLPFREFFPADVAPWEWITAIKSALSDFDFDVSQRDDLPPGLHVDGPVYIHPSVKLPPFGSITGPTYIGANCELRPGVYIRGNIIAGEGCVLGNSCEFKNSLLLDRVQVPHFSYVGDSILGNGSHLGAGVICSNLRLDQANVPVSLKDGTRHLTDLRKFGAIIGDGAEVGCNAVLNPGSILGKRSLVMPTMAFRGTVASATIAHQETVIKTTPRTD